MIETVFTLEDEPMTPDAPQEGGGMGDKGGEGMPAGEPESRLVDDEGGDSESESND